MKPTIMRHTATKARIQLLERRGTRTKVRFLSVGKGTRTGMIDNACLAIDWEKVK